MVGVRIAAARLAMLRHRRNAQPHPATLGNADAKVRRKVGTGKEKGEKKEEYLQNIPKNSLFVVVVIVNLLLSFYLLLYDIPLNGFKHIGHGLWVGIGKIRHT